MNKLRGASNQGVIQWLGILSWLAFTGWLLGAVVYPTVRDYIPLTVEQYQRWGQDTGSGRNYSEHWLNSME